MKTPGSPAPQYQVSYCGVVRGFLVDLGNRVSDKNFKQALLNALKIIDNELHRDPRSFGDPYYSLKKMRLDWYARVVPPLLVHYGVHKTKNVVFVTKIAVMTGKQPQ